MTTIEQLFSNQVDRHIEGVIKADDLRHLKQEIDEFVVTREIAKGLYEFVGRYLDEPKANGAWISGFFGSGKSHLLKMLSLLLNDSPLPDGTHPIEIILPKIEDQILRGDLRKACGIPSESILFNIDQKADHIGGAESALILEVFVKVFNGLQGYDAKQGYVARFEKLLDRDRKLEDFKRTYESVNGRPWEKDRDGLATIRRKAFAKAYARHASIPESEANEVLRQLRDEYRVSIESFAQEVNEYIQSKGEHFRLNFFVDEVGQFIGNDSQLMLNLQTIAESLATHCNGRAWVLVTSQGDLKTILGEIDGTSSQDFTKIQGRFKTRLTLTSADVREVIQKRLLDKAEPEPAPLRAIHESEQENLATLFRFSHDSISYKGWPDCQSFCDFYPFHPYQFDLFQRAIEQLSKHDMFTGKHTSVGERSMLEVFQSVVKGIKDEPMGRLATFDRLFEGIQSTLRGDVQTSIIQAGDHLEDPLALRILKALFLLKWVRGFKANPRNVSILLIDRADIEIGAHEKAVETRLETLARQSYLQKNGEHYEFLTNLEKDIQVEIQNTEVNDAEVTKLLGEIFFSDVLRDPKVRYEANSQDYPYARKLDDQLVGKDAEIGLHLITPEHPNHGDKSTLASQGTGKPELMFVLPADHSLHEESRTFLKTRRYVQNNTGDTHDETRQAILNERAVQNSARRTALKSLAEELVGKSKVFLNGSELHTAAYSDPRTRFHKCAQELITFAFPNLRMLKGSYDEDSLENALLEPDDLLSSGNHALSEAESEIINYLQRNQQDGNRTVVGEVVRSFGRRPYGWYPMAVATLLARLFRLGKIELRTNNEPLDAPSARDGLRNTRQHDSIRASLQESFDPSKVNALKRFYQEFFDRVNTGTDARSAGAETLLAMKKEVDQLESLLNQRHTYPFVGELEPFVQRLRELLERDHAFLIKNLDSFRDELLTAKEDWIDPIKAFMAGPQRRSYDEAIAFFREEEANFPDLPVAEVRPLQALVSAEAPYRGNIIPEAKAAVTALREKINDRLAAERRKSEAVLDDHENRIRNLAEFPKLDPPAQTEVLETTAEARQAIATARFLTTIRDKLNRYRDQDYPAQLELVARLAAPTPSEPGPGGDPKPPAPTSYVPANSLRANCPLPYIATEAELDEWLASLRSAALREIEKGHRISL